MKLTKEQRVYLERKINTIYGAKTAHIKRAPYFGLGNIKENYPKRINAALLLIKEYEEADQKRFKEQLAPYTKAKEELLEKLLFQENYEEIIKLVAAFEQL